MRYCTFQTDRKKKNKSRAFQTVREVTAISSDDANESLNSSVMCEDMQYSID